MVLRRTIVLTVHVAVARRRVGSVERVATHLLADAVHCLEGAPDAIILTSILSCGCVGGRDALDFGAETGAGGRARSGGGPRCVGRGSGVARRGGVGGICVGGVHVSRDEGEW